MILLPLAACSDDEIPSFGPPITVQSSASTEADAEPPSQTVMCAGLDAGSD